MSAARAWALFVALSASEAHAHLVETGFGAFYDGLAHVALTPADLLVVVAIALLAGQRGTAAARYAMFALPLAWLAGGLIGARWPGAGAWPAWTTVTFLVAGALVALNARLRDAGVAALAVAAGLLHGLVNGAISAVFCMTAIFAAEVSELPSGWPRIAVRVGASWIAAAGMLMLGWLARG